jgi:tight adherence protein B
VQTLVFIYVIVVVAFYALFQGLLTIFAASAPAANGTLRRKTLGDGLSPWLADHLVVKQIHRFESLVGSSGIGASPGRVLAGMAAGVLAAGVLALASGSGPISAAAIGLSLGVAVPLLVIGRLRAQRMARLVLQVPEALDMMVRSLRAGHPVPTGIGMVATEMPDPIGSEFRRVFDGMSLGLELKDALETMSERLDVNEIRYMVAAIRIQFSTGGNLAEILASLAAVMRERVQLLMKVKALSAESRLSANIMAVMPFILIGGILYLRPQLYEDVPVSPVLQIILGGAALLLVAGIILMRRVVAIRV